MNEAYHPNFQRSEDMRCQQTGEAKNCMICGQRILNEIDTSQAIMVGRTEGLTREFGPAAAVIIRWRALYRGLSEGTTREAFIWSLKLNFIYCTPSTYCLIEVK